MPSWCVACFRACFGNNLIEKCNSTIDSPMGCCHFTTVASRDFAWLGVISLSKSLEQKFSNFGLAIFRTYCKAFFFGFLELFSNFSRVISRYFAWFHFFLAVHMFHDMNCLFICWWFVWINLSKHSSGWCALSLSKDFDGPDLVVESLSHSKCSDHGGCWRGFWFGPG